MGLDLLDTPVRLTWDIPEPPGETDSAELTAIAEAIVDGGVFFVTLQGRPLQRPAVQEIVEVLDGACQILVHCGGSDAELAVLDALPANAQLLLDTQGFLDSGKGLADERLQGALEVAIAKGFNPSLALTPLRSNLSQIPELLKFCSRLNVPRFKLPNAHIGDSFQQYSADDLPRWQDLEKFSGVWREFERDKLTLPELEIHDLFLWEIMTPGQDKARSEYGGCQAGNSLAHVDVHGVVYPCAAWPQPLGRLPGQTLEEIWAAPTRISVVEEIAKTPQGCAGCLDIDTCFGGCRGLGKHLNTQAGERDLMCRGQRS